LLQSDQIRVLKYTQQEQDGLAETWTRQ